MITPELKNKVENKVLDTLEKAQQIWGNDKITSDLLPIIDYNLTGRCAGRAVYNSGINPIIKINKGLLVQNEAYMLNQTIPHEIAHIITRKLYSNYYPKPHGYEWKMVMTKLGLPPKRCHNMDISTVIKRNKREYNCKCLKCNDVFKVSSIIKNRIDGGKSYHHNQCGGKVIVSQIPV